MKNSLLFVFFYLLAACQSNDEVFVTGIPVLESSGQLTLFECGSSLQYQLGAIESNPNFDFLTEIEGINSNLALTVDVMGKIESKTPLVLENPVIVNFSSTNCQT